MKNKAHFKILWNDGLAFSQISFIDHDVFSYQCGNTIKFVHLNEIATEQKDEHRGEHRGEHRADHRGHYLTPENFHGIHSFTCSHQHKTVAVAEMGPRPKIAIYEFPSLKRISSIEGGATLEYLAMEFSTDNVFVTVTGLPDYEIVLWDWRTGDRLTSAPLGLVRISSMSFNPCNWRQLCLCANGETIFWTIEHSGKDYLLKSRRVKAPSKDARVGHVEDFSDKAKGQKNIDIDDELQVPLFAVAEIKYGDDGEQIADEVGRLSCVSHAWMPDGAIMVGCQEGHLIKMDIESSTVQVMAVAGREFAEAGIDRSKTALTDLISEVSETELIYSEINPGCVRHLVLHKQGLLAAGEDGILRVFNLLSDRALPMDSHDVGQPIKFMTFSPFFDQLMLVLRSGTVTAIKPSRLEQRRHVLEEMGGAVVGVCYVGSNVVTVRGRGVVQVWSGTDGHTLSHLNLTHQATAMAGSPLFPLCVVGTGKGHMLFVDVKDSSKPKLFKSVCMHKGSVRRLLFDQRGDVIVSYGDDSRIFILSGRATLQFQVFGHIPFPGVSIVDVGFYRASTESKIRFFITSSEDGEPAANTVVLFECPASVLQDGRDLWLSDGQELDPEKLNFVRVSTPTPTIGAILVDQDTMLAMDNNSKCVVVYKLPDQQPKKGAKANTLSADQQLLSHHLPGGRVQVSFNRQWIFSYGSDGRIALRHLTGYELIAAGQMHHYAEGGIVDAAMSHDGQMVAAVSPDGVVCCARLESTSEGNELFRQASRFAHNFKGEMEADRTAEDQAVDEAPEVPPPPHFRVKSDFTDDKEKDQSTNAEERCWVEAKQMEIQAELNRTFAATKQSLREKLNNIRLKIDQMMEENRTKPDLERLEEHEFDLDVHEQDRLQKELDLEVQKLREDIELENLSRLYLREVIKKECWDAMKIKGKSMSAFNALIEVQNFPLMERSSAETQELQFVKKQRQLQLEELKIRRQVVEQFKRRTTETGAEIVSETDDVENQGKETTTTIGSFSSQIGINTELLYSQFELHTRLQKQFQVILLRDIVNSIKEKFNEKFEETLMRKEQEISKIKDKNAQIRKIVKYLKLEDEIWEPTLTVDEQPESVLRVNDAEIKAQKYMPPEEKKKLEEQKQRELKQQGAKGKRELGLDDMMGGVLEVSKEDELSKDVPRPAFLDEKEEDHWTPEERKQAEGYQQKYRELEEEREKYKKYLENELKRLLAQVQEIANGFDGILKDVFTERIRIQQTIYQEELKIARIRFQLLVENELNWLDSELNQMNEVLKDRRVDVGELVRRAGDTHAGANDQYENLVAEDRLLDKNFKREFSDVALTMFDQLSKLFRKRPRGKGAVPMLGRGASRVPTRLAEEFLANNPYADRPDDADARRQQQRLLEEQLLELDAAENKPDGIDLDTWERFCEYRKKKILTEVAIKVRAMEIAEMNEFHQRRSSEEEQLRLDVDRLILEMKQLREKKAKFINNLQIQLILRQGQVEVDPGEFVPDYSKSLLISRRVVEDLNSTIRQLGTRKVKSMIEIKDFRKKMVMIEWEHRKMRMEIDDLRTKARNIQNFKITREIQEFLNSSDFDAKISSEIQILEQTIAKEAENHANNVQATHVHLQELIDQVEKLRKENDGLDQQLGEINVSVNERDHIHEIKAEEHMAAKTRGRMHLILQRSRLIELAKVQAQEIAILRAEVERLRMRTFPALVQIEH